MKSMARLFIVVSLTGALMSYAGCRSPKSVDNSAQASGNQSIIPTEGTFISRTLKAGKEEYHYQVYVPAGGAQEGKRPVILFLHGSGERGQDNERQTEIGLGPVIRREAARFPFIVVFPQCRVGLTWLDARMEAVALGALDDAVREYGGDEERIYLTGVSMGGIGSWHLTAKHPGKFAAVVPVSGRSPLRGLAEDPEGEIARRVGNIPVWVFHGDEDQIVGVENSRRIVAALRRLGNNANFTEYAGVGHNSWDSAYAEPELVPWLLSHRLQRSGSVLK
jgi:predicted peptidase